MNDNSQNQIFSKRYGLREAAQEITVRNDAPPKLREAVLAIAHEVADPHLLRNIVCGVLRCLPDQNNWSTYPNVWNEVQDLVLGCKWYQVYDIIQVIYATLKTRAPEDAEKFRGEINLYFMEEGIGWQLTERVSLEIRGSEGFESVIVAAEHQLDSAGQATAASEIREAIRDLSRRPQPDLTGAVQHSMAALECVARVASSSPKATLGDILARNPGLLPTPLDQAVEKIWGYASEMARHVREGRTPSFEEVELLVGQAASAATYLSKKLGLSRA